MELIRFAINMFMILVFKSEISYFFVCVILTPCPNVVTNIVMAEYGRHKMVIPGVHLLSLVLLLMRVG